MNIYPDKPYSRNKGLKLPEDEQKKILDKCQNLYEKMMNAALHFNDDETQRAACSAYYSYLSDLEDKEIYVERGWVGHLNEHFLPSDEDAWKQEEWLDMLREDC